MARRFSCECFLSKRNRLLKSYYSLSGKVFYLDHGRCDLGLTLRNLIKGGVPLLQDQRSIMLANEGYFVVEGNFIQI